MLRIGEKEQTACRGDLSTLMAYLPCLMWPEHEQGD